MKRHLPSGDVKGMGVYAINGTDSQEDGLWLPCLALCVANLLTYLLSTYGTRLIGYGKYLPLEVASHPHAHGRVADTH